MKSSHQSNNLVRLSESAPAYIKKFLCSLHCVPSPLTHTYSTYLLSLLNTSHPGFIHLVLLGFIPQKFLRKSSIIQSELSWPFRVHPSRNYSVKYSSSWKNSSSFTNNLSRNQDALAIECFINHKSSLGRYVFGSEISYNKPPPRLPGLGC